MYYSDELIEEVRSKNDIVDVISEYVKLTRKGSNYFGLCPFHNEKSPSFSVSPSKQMFFCFGCHAGGNVFTFLMKYENCDFTEAVRELAARAGVSLPDVQDNAETRARDSERQKVMAANREAATYFYRGLRSERGSEGMKYLQGRKLTPETMQHFGLGFAGVSSCDLVRYLRSKGFEDKTIIDAGLASYDEKRGMHDKFWNRVMFPIMDISNHVIAFGGRVMGDGKPKYLNSPETAIFDKSRNLYALNYARTARKGSVILCEGYMDVISMHQAGFTQAVASLGTSFTDGQANILRRYTENVLLAYDSDGPGISAALRAIKILKSAGMSGRVINMQPYKDPDEFIKALGPEEFQKRLDSAENSFLFEVRISERDYDMQDPESRTRFQKSVAQRLCEFEEGAERDNYMLAVSEKYGIKPDNLRKLVISFASEPGFVRASEQPRSGVKDRISPDENVKKDQRLLITWITERPELYFKIADCISADDFTDELYRQVAGKVFEDIRNDTFNPAAIVSTFTEEDEQRQVAELFNTTLRISLETPAEREKAFHDIVYAVKKNSFEHSAAESDTGTGSLQKMLAEKKKLEELAHTRIIIE